MRISNLRLVLCIITGITLLLLSQIIQTLRLVLCIITGKTYRLRISNVGLKTSLNFRIQDHDMLLVETEGSYVQKRTLSNLDIHVGQSYSVLVTAKTDPIGSHRSYYIFASTRFSNSYMTGLALIRYPNSPVDPVGPVPAAPESWDYASSVRQTLSIRYLKTIFYVNIHQILKFPRIIQFFFTLIKYFLLINTHN